MENQLYKWTADIDEHHEPWEHGAGIEERPGPLIAVRNSREGPASVMLERALALAGLLHRAVEADRSGNSTDGLDQLTLTGVIATFGEREIPAHNLGFQEQWLTRADRVSVNCRIEHPGQEPVDRTFESDLALAPALQQHPAVCHAAVTKTSRMTATLLQQLILGAYSRNDDGAGLDEHRDSATAIADMVLNGQPGRLSAVEQLVRNRVLPCIPRAAWRGDPIGIRLWDSPEAPYGAEAYKRGRPWNGSSRKSDIQGDQERRNRIRYEGTVLEGHRGALLGIPIQPGTRLWYQLATTGGERLWEPDDAIEGRLKELGDADLKGAVIDDTGIAATHAVVWMTGKSGSVSEAVHLLNGTEVEALRRRMTGPLIEAAIGWVGKTDPRDYPADHPLRLLAEEYAVRTDGP